MSIEHDRDDADEKEWALLRSQLECPKCHETLASIHRHDFQTCGCGETSLDGGLDYMRIAGNWILTISDEERRALNHCLFISGGSMHNKHSKATALEIYKCLWEASQRGEVPAPAVAVWRQGLIRDERLGTEWRISQNAVAAYLKMFQDTEAVERTTKGWIPKVKLVEREDAP